MKLNTSQLPDVTDFTYQDCEFGGEECVWIFPHLEGVKWTEQNLIFRSSIWRKSDWTLVSAGFKKFFNWAQHPEIEPPPDALSAKIDCVEKLDGSCLVVTRFNGELIIRTRRALARTMLNGDEIEFFQDRYPRVFDCPLLETEKRSFIFEWLTPSNRIVVGYEKPEIRLIGCVRHEDYSYIAQKELDRLAEAIEVQRPNYYNYDSLEQMLANVADLKGEEGVCVYYGNGQKIRKIKSDWYLSVHNFRNAMNLKNIVDLYFISGMPDYQEFCNKVQEQFQWEGLNMARPLISMVVDAMKEVRRIIDGMVTFIMKMGKIQRKDAAVKILAAYGDTNRSGMLFTLLDNKPLGKEQYKKLLFQCLV